METRPASLAERRHFRFHQPHVYLASVFGDTWFGEKAEGFARFFGTPTFLVGQTLVVAIWIAVNVIGWTRFVGEARGRRVLIMVTYHLGQIGLVLGLLG